MGQDRGLTCVPAGLLVAGGGRAAAVRHGDAGRFRGGRDGQRVPRLVHRHHVRRRRGPGPRPGPRGGSGDQGESGLGGDACPLRSRGPRLLLARLGSCLLRRPHSHRRHCSVARLLWHRSARVRLLASRRDGWIRDGWICARGSKGCLGGLPQHTLVSRFDSIMPTSGRISLRGAVTSAARRSTLGARLLHRLQSLPTQRAAMLAATVAEKMLRGRASQRLSLRKCTAQSARVGQR